MKPQQSALWLVLGLMFSAGALAAPCKLERNEHGMWTSTCTLDEILYGDFIKTARIVSDPYPIKLPDLYADDGDYFVSGTRVDIEVRTGNQGQWASRDFDVTANVIITGGGMAPTMRTVTGRVQGIDVGDRTRTVIGYVVIPDRISDYDLDVTFHVDSNGMSSGGEVWELNESNNILNDGVCRVYGENPDTTVPPCQ